MRHNKKADMSLQKVIAFILVVIVFLVLFLWSPSLYSKAHDGIDSVKFSSAEKTCEINSENSNIFNCDLNVCTEKQDQDKWKNYLNYLNDKECNSLKSNEVGVAKDKACTCLQQKIYDIKIGELLVKQEELSKILSNIPLTSASQSDINNIKLSYKNLEPEFLAKVEKISKNLETKPEYLMAAMAFETGGTFDPCKKNPKSGATGLIQFMEPTAIGLGTTQDKLCKMTRIEQLDYVEKHFLPKKGKLNTLNDVYLAVLYPVAVGKGEDYVLFRDKDVKYNSEGKRIDAYYQNSKLDINNNGEISAGEAVQKVASLYDPSIFVG